MPDGTLVNAAIVIAIIVAVIVGRLSWSELENSGTDVWRGPVVTVGIGLYQLHDKLPDTKLGAADVILLVLGVTLAYLVLRLGLAGVGHLAGARITSGGGSLLLTLGANLLVQSVVVQSEAHRQAGEYASR